MGARAIEVATTPNIRNRFGALDMKALSETNRARHGQFRATVIAIFEFTI